MVLGQLRSRMVAVATHSRRRCTATQAPRRRRAAAPGCTLAPLHDSQAGKINNDLPNVWSHGSARLGVM